MEIIVHRCLGQGEGGGLAQSGLSPEWWLQAPGPARCRLRTFKHLIGWTDALRLTLSVEREWCLGGLNITIPEGDLRRSQRRLQQPVRHLFQGTDTLFSERVRRGSGFQSDLCVSLDFNCKNIIYFQPTPHRSSIKNPQWFRWVIESGGLIFLWTCIFMYFLFLFYYYFFHF